MGCSLLPESQGTCGDMQAQPDLSGPGHCLFCQEKGQNKVAKESTKDPLPVSPASMSSPIVPLGHTLIFLLQVLACSLSGCGQIHKVDQKVFLQSVAWPRPL